MSLRENDLLIISYCNYLYREIALNWVRALENLGVDNYLIFSIDEECHNFLKARGVNSRLHLIPDLPQKQAQGGMTRKMGVERFRIIGSLLKEGVNVVYSDLDAVWVKNPLKILENFSEFDILSSTVRQTGAWPPLVAQKWGFTLCTGWFGFKASPSTVLFITELIDFFLNSKRPPPGNFIVCDQDAFNSYLVDSEFTPLPLEDHQAILQSPLSEYSSLRVLAIDRDLIHRGGGSPASVVIHPVSEKTGEKTKKKLQAKNIWFLDE